MGFKHHILLFLNTGGNINKIIKVSTELRESTVKFQFFYINYKDSLSAKKRHLPENTVMFTTGRHKLRKATLNIKLCVILSLDNYVMRQILG